MARGLSPDPRGLPALVADHLLFGFLAAVIDRETTRIFGVGDGVWAVNGSSVTLDPGPGNAPPYLAYRLLEGHDYPQPERLAEPLLHFRAPTETVRSLVIGSDGLADLPPGGLLAFTWEEAYLMNPLQVQRRLVVLGGERRGLPDDTSLVLVRRRSAR